MSEIVQGRLLDALNERDMAAVARYLRAGADPNDLTQDVSPMHKAAELGFVPGLQELHRAGGNLDLRTCKDQQYVMGTTPLMTAALNKHIDAVQWLLDHGADAHLVNENALTVLCAVINQHHDALARMLLAARPELKDGQLNASARALVSNANRVAADKQFWLLDLGVNPNLTDVSGEPWLVCVQDWPTQPGAADRMAVATELIRHGADLNQASLQGVTPLRRAIARGNKDMFMLLLQAGADPDLVFSDGQTARKLLRSSKSNRLAEMRDAFQAWTSSQRAWQSMGEASANPRPL